MWYRTFEKRGKARSKVGGMVGRCCCVGLIVDPITTNHATRPSPRRRSMMPVSGLRLDAPVPIPDHVVVQHADEPVHGDAREAPFVEELLFDPAEEPLCGGVVRPASLRAHRTRQIVFLADADPFRPPVVTAMVGMDDWFLPVLERGTRVQQHGHWPTPGSPTQCSSMPRNHCRRERIPWCVPTAAAITGGLDGWSSWTATA